MLTILHGSDVHFGKPHDSAAEKLFLAEVDRIEPDVVVLAGDFTQRAKPREYSEVRDFLSGFGSRPTVVTPGNHDVALFRVWERLANPFANYRRYVHPELDHVFRIPGATFVSLNTAAPRRAIVNGRLDPTQLRFAARVFHEGPRDDLKCVVMHHPLVGPPDRGGDPTVPGAEEKLARLGGMGVEIVFAGHLHRAFAVQPIPGGPVLSHSGTAMSNRGRRAESGMNSFNVVRVDEMQIGVTRYLRPGDGGFEETWTTNFERTRPAAEDETESGMGVGREQ
jgi:3',5'-cyclic AMP phosphodiesterase CpdA